jgi:hypothetical protein
VELGEKTQCPLANGFCEMDSREILTQRTTENSQRDTEKNNKIMELKNEK